MTKRNTAKIEQEIEDASERLNQLNQDLMIERAIEKLSLEYVDNNILKVMLVRSSNLAEYTDNCYAVFHLNGNEYRVKINMNHNTVSSTQELKEQAFKKISEAISASMIDGLFENHNYKKY